MGLPRTKSFSVLSFLDKTCYGLLQGSSKARRVESCRRKTCVQLVRSLCMKVPGLAWRIARTGLRRAICWRSCVMRCASSTGCAIDVSSLQAILRGSPYTSSATNACRFALKDVWIPSRKRGSASVQYWSAWHVITAFSVQWKRSTSPLVAG
jgi:hypothetical protein